MKIMLKLILLLNFDDIKKWVLLRFKLSGPLFIDYEESLINFPDFEWEPNYRPKPILK